MASNKKNQLTPQQEALLAKLEAQEQKRKAYHKAYNSKKTPAQKQHDKEYHQAYNRSRREMLVYLRAMLQSGPAETPESATDTPATEPQA